MFISIGHQSFSLFIPTFCYTRKQLINNYSTVYTHPIIDRISWISFERRVSIFISFLIFSQECITVVWSLPPSFSPIEGYEILKSSLNIYIIICLGFITSFFLVLS